MLKRILFAISAMVLVASWITFAQTPAPASKPIKIPDAQAARIKELQQQSKQIDLQIQNTLLDAFLELGLKKADLATLQVQVDDKGVIWLVPKPPEKETSKNGKSSQSPDTSSGQ